MSVATYMQLIRAFLDHEVSAAEKERGVRVMAYLEEGTPDEAIRLAKQWLGDENAMLFKWHEHP